MSRTGVEAKPPWSAVPLAVRQRTEAMLGAPVARGMRVFGGYSPTPTFRLALSDGQRAFFKGTNPAATEFAQQAHVREERVYRDASGLIGPWAPGFFGAFQQDDWRVLLLEDAGPQSAPPWTPSLTRAVAHAYSAFHASTLGRDLPAWLPHMRQTLPSVTWSRVAAESDGLRTAARLAGERASDAQAWLEHALPLFTRLADGASDLPGPFALLHGDTRSDNLRFRRGRLSLFDWPSAEAGRPEFDLAAFAQSITVEGGVDPEQFVAWYGERGEIRASALDVAVAWMTAFFADLAWRPVIPGLPRLRRFQRQQLAVLLRWAARRFGLPAPDWAATLGAT